MKSSAPIESVSSTLLHRVLIYAKEGNSNLVDGRWNLSQSEAKLGVKLSADERQQLMACTGQIVCKTPDVHTEDEDRVGIEIKASAVSVLSPDLLVTAKHVFFQGKTAAVSFGSCSFRSFSRRNVAVPILVEQDQRKGYVFNNEDFIVLRLKRALAGCDSFALNPSDSFLREEEEIFSVTGRQLGTLNKISSREPLVARGKIRKVFDGVLGGPPFYYADIDFDIGGSGGAVFALKDGRPVSDDRGRLILRAISVAYGPRAKNGRPYSEEQNYTIVIGLQAEFRELVAGKANKPAAVEAASCPAGGTPKIDVISVPLSKTGALAPFPRTEPANGWELAASPRAKPKPLQRKRLQQVPAKPKPPKKEQYEFTLKNGTSCRICFTYNRCNNYGCWDQAVKLSAKSSLFAGVGERAPVIKNPQFCKSGPPIADAGPPLPPRKLEQTAEIKFMAAKEKAKRDGVHALTAEDIRGLSLEQIKALRGY